MGQPNFGVFNIFWNGQPNHLPLMTLQYDNDEPKEWNLKKSLSLIESIVSENATENILTGVVALLDNEDWRAHVVAILSIAKLQPDIRTELIDNLWLRLGKGSWISPQILVVLSLIDINFEEKAMTILENGFEIKYEKKLSAPEHHSSRGPGSRFSESNKVIAACKNLIDGEIWEDEKYDNGGLIAMSWKKQLLELNDKNIFNINLK